MTSARHIVCPSCGGVNRVPADRKAAEAKCGVCHKPLFSGHPVPVTMATFDKHVARNDIPVVVDFWADWCGPCKAMAPVFERVTGEFEPDVRFLKLDTDREPTVAARYRIRGIPTLILFNRGSVAAQRAGAMDASTLKAWLRENLPSAS